MISGSHKAIALKECLEGNINNTWTITVLQQHRKCLIACDKPSTKELKIKTLEYFKNLQERTNILGEPNFNYIKRFIKNRILNYKIFYMMLLNRKGNRLKKFIWSWPKRVIELIFEIETLTATHIIWCFSISISFFQ